jgi:membrane protein
VSKTVERATTTYARGRLWIENVDPASRKGATVGWVRRYQAADGQLFAVLLAAYIFLTLLPLLLLESTYVYGDPHALADRVVHRLKLEGATAELLRAILVGANGHKLSAVLIAAVNLFFFGLGLGRVLQIAHARSWGLDLRKSVIADQTRYLSVLAALAALTLLFVVQAHALQGHPSWIAWLLDVVWLAVLLAFFVWAPWLLLHKRVPWRDIVPGAVFTMLGLIGLRLVSVLLFAHWLEWYSKTYGSVGIVMAIFFWLVVFGTVLVLAAALSPALAHRRDLRRAK